MKRFPNGVDADFFHQKRVPANHPEYVDEIFVQFPSGHSTVFAIVDNAAALAWVANLGCIELHTWHSRVPEIERPDYLLIDLDPTTDGQWPFVREIALVVKEVLDELGLRSYPKTSGATGLHILAPIRPELLFPDVRRLAKAIAVEVERRVGDQAVATTTWRVADRVGVFVDFGQNARDRTIASAYSVRPTPDARVSAPLRWDEVAAVEPEAFTLRDDARADRRRRRPDARHVAQPTVPAPPLRQARPRATRRLTVAATPAVAEDHVWWQPPLGRARPIADTGSARPGWWQPLWDVRVPSRTRPFGDDLRRRRGFVRKPRRHVDAGDLAYAVSSGLALAAGLTQAELAAAVCSTRKTIGIDRTRTCRIPSVSDSRSRSRDRSRRSRRRERSSTSSANRRAAARCRARSGRAAGAPRATCSRAGPCPRASG